MDPNKSLPMPRGEHLLATSPASPPFEPPVDLRGFQGFFALPQRALEASRDMNPCGMLVFKKGIAPSFLKTAITRLS